jgi:TRAP-type C4-dicarboxylate transport system substrate-binding protein
MLNVLAYMRGQSSDIGIVIRLIIKENIMKKLNFILLVVIVISSLILVGCGEAETITKTATKTETATETVKPITLIFQSLDISESPWGNVLLPWFAELEEVSGGRVKVEVHWNSELVPMTEVYDAVVKGTLDIGQTVTSVPAGRFPMEEVGAFTSYDVNCNKMSRVFWELHQEFPEMLEPFSDTKVLGIICPFPNPISTTERFGPVITLEDNQGLKEGVWGEWMSKVGAALGRTGVSLLPTETYSAFEKGVADGMQTSLSLFESTKFGEVLHYVTVMNGTLSTHSIVMNLDAWNSLPEDVQQFIDDSSEELVDAFDLEFSRIEEYSLETYPEKFGTEFVEVPEEEFARWIEAIQPVLDEFIASLEAQGLPGTELVEEFHRLEKVYAAE